jgi:hypothetical protein
MTKAKAAINAIKQACSAPVQEPVEFFDWYDNAHWGNEDFKEGCHRSWNAAIKYTTPPAAPVQEPVCDKDPQGCWNVRCQLGKKCKNTQPETPVPKGMVLLPKRMTQAMRDVTDQEDWTWEDLLAAADAITEDEYAEIAAQRQWVGLTDEEIHELWYKVKGEAEPFARAIEAKLKENT